MVAWLASLAACSAPVRVQTPHGGLRLTRAENAVRLDIGYRWFRVESAQSDADVIFVSAENQPTGVVLSAALQRPPSSRVDCRSFYWENVRRTPGLETTDIQLSQYDRFKLVSYTVPQANGQPVQQRNVLACAELGGLYGFLHLSKAAFVPGEQILFDSVLASASMSRGPSDPAVSRRHFPAPGHGFLALDLNDSWVTWMRLPALDLPPTISIVPSDSNDWEILATVHWNRADGKSATSPEDLQAELERTRSKVGAEREDTEQGLHPWKNANGFGAYFAGQLRDPKPTEFKYMNHGLMRTGDLVLHVTVSAHTQNAAIFARALEILRGARQTSAPDA